MSTTVGTSPVQALAAANTGLDTLADLAPWQLLDTDVATMVTEIETLTRRLAGVQLSVIAEGITRGLPFATGSGTGAGAPGRWVRSLIPITPGEASGRTRLAQALFPAAAPGPTGRALADVLAPTREAVLAGTISLEQARVITTALTTLSPPATPAGLIDEVTLTGAQRMLLSSATGTIETAAIDPHSSPRPPRP